MGQSRNSSIMEVFSDTNLPQETKKKKNQMFSIKSRARTDAREYIFLVSVRIFLYVEIQSDQVLA